ncbi:Coenzyme PQQ synthesis protein D (PqqD) [Tistlia consotensis]|uniref:Coenzyme PQQ synthesis protein D (PqqD) n=1 Tax=Tistlia consotensis USBA 355 TaxID=560819 RepID=A0A1Y6CM70_9PROT|nr:PqqD family protein [Tistlia consotensis]SMF62976.1 Coenzyme PQQ synthesis protein D (PqqD) [Tistlia consotensis USBA 355]SNR95357.1 Coenzyme PQQ synthesis protein D (PqqD) [Tistlia consotensis]
MSGLRRNPAVTTTEIEGEFFLVEPASGEIFYLDAVTSGIWRLVEQPCDEAEILSTLAAAFPETAAERLRGDVGRLLAEMRQARLLLPA